MSKKIVLKSLLAVVMVGFVLSLSSCKKDEKKIIGKWKYEKIEVKNLVCSDPTKTNELKSKIEQFQNAFIGMVSEVEFTEDGKMITRGLLGGEDQTSSYKVKDGKIIVNDEASDLSFSGKKMYWERDMDKETLEGLAMFFGEDAEITKCTMRATLTKK